MKASLRPPAPQASPANDTIQRHTVARMCRSDLLERFTRTSPVVPGLLFVPVVGLSGWVGLARAGLPLFIVCIALGLLLWTLTEYSLHRWLFHVPERGPVSRFINFTFHGVHHQFPDDPHRLVMVPLVSIPLAVAFWSSFHAVLPASMSDAVFCGMVFGYLAYDYSHWTAHYVSAPSAPWARPLARLMRAQRKRHMRHHFDDPERGYGVSVGLWDRVFGTDNMT